MKRALAVCVAAALSSGCLGQEFVQLPAAFRVRCVSGDGLMVGGSYYNSEGLQPAVWTEAGGVRTLRRLDGSAADGYVFALSVDGAVAVGTTHDQGHQSAFRWTEAGLVPMRPSSGCLVSAYGVSDDGSVVGGNGFLWTESAGLRDVGRDSQNCLDGPNGVSGDGRVCAGPLNGGVWRWSVDDLQGTMISPGADSGASLCRVNRTGDVIVGFFGSRGSTGFIWTPAGFQVVSETRQLTDVSADGRAAVGNARSGGACYYTEGLGMVDLAVYAGSFGIDLLGSTLSLTVGISDDGRTIVGTGLPHDWLLRLPAARPGDFNGDEETTADDLVSYLDCFVGEGALPPSAADVNRDDFTDWADFDQFLADFGG